MIVAHVNHASRGAENDIDEVFVRHFVEKLREVTDALVEYKTIKLNPDDLNVGASWEKTQDRPAINGFQKSQSKTRLTGCLPRTLQMIRLKRY